MSSTTRPSSSDLWKVRLSSLDPRLRRRRASLGADPRRVWWRVILPLLRARCWRLIVLVFLFDFTSFGVILLLGGPSFATLEVQIYIQALSLLNLPVASFLSAHPASFHDWVLGPLFAPGIRAASRYDAAPSGRKSAAGASTVRQRTYCRGRRRWSFRPSFCLRCLRSRFARSHAWMRIAASAGQRAGWPHHRLLL